MYTAAENKDTTPLKITPTKAADMFILQRQFRIDSATAGEGGNTAFVIIVKLTNFFMSSHASYETALRTLHGQVIRHPRKTTVIGANWSTLFTRSRCYFVDGGIGDELQLKISKAESASRFEKNSPPEVLRVIEGANRH